MSLSLLLTNARTFSRPNGGVDTSVPPGGYAVPLRRGDILFETVEGNARHVLMVAPDASEFIHSTYPAGVNAASGGPMQARAYRFVGQDNSQDPVPQRASYLAQEWIGRVRYADGKGWRALLAGVGSSKFGSGAQGRLLKYQGREVNSASFTDSRPASPKNAICSELCVLAYQLSCPERHAAFIRLDAKHCTPELLRRYFDADADNWRCIIP